MMRAIRTRRAFMRTIAAAPFAAPFVSRLPRPSPAASSFEPAFAPAYEALRALRHGVVSSRELTEICFRRIRKHNPRINAFITLIEDQAMHRARLADEALAAGNTLPGLHGLPILVKDSIATAGVRTTSGSKQLENHVPREDAPAVARLRAAGAILIGKTNLPEFASDLQSYNEVAGTTNNPWDPVRTPGGSTGGGAAALAAGFAYLELGSDIGGSIRTPCHFCGLYGLKPTLNVVPPQGHIPPMPGVPVDHPDLYVLGPLARSARDLGLELEVLGGPSAPSSLAYRWSLPSPRGTRLRDYRIGFVSDDKFCRLGSDVAQVLSAAIDALRRAGVQLEEGWPPGFHPEESFANYWRLLSAYISPDQPESLLREIRQAAGRDPYCRVWIEGAELDHRGWSRETESRLKARAVWQEFFRTHDAFLMPENFVPAFRHDHSSHFFARTVATPEGSRPYAEMLRWISPATLTGCPAAVAPVGRTRERLPVGVQIMGPYMEDATPIQIAGLMADVIGGYEPPPGFD